MTLLPRDVDRMGASSLITRATNDVMQVQTMLDMALRVMIKFPANCIGGLIMAFLLDVKMGLILLAVTPVLVVFSIIMVKSAMPIYEKVQRSFDAFNKALEKSSPV